MRLTSFFSIVCFFVFTPDSLAQTIRYLPIPPPVVSTLPPCRADRTGADDQSTGFMVVLRTPIPASLRNSSTRDIQVFFDISRDSLFPSDVFLDSPGNIGRKIGMALYSNCFSNAINFNGQTDTIFTSSRFISNQMLALSQGITQFPLLDDSTYYIRAFTYIVTDSTIIVSPPSKVFFTRARAQLDLLSFGTIQSNSMRPVVAFSEPYIRNTPRPVIDSILVEADTDSLFRQPHQIMIPLTRILRSSSTMFYTYENRIAFTNLRPATQYFFRTRPFLQGLPVRPYFKAFVQTTAAVPTEKISISSYAIDALAYILDNKARNFLGCTNTFVYTRNAFLTPQQADSIMLTVVNRNIEFFDNIYFQDSTGKAEILVRVSDFLTNAEELMTPLGFVRKNIDWVGLCKCVNMRSYYAKPLTKTATTITDDNYTLSLSTAPNPLSDEADISFSLPLSGFASISLLDMRGTRIASVAEGTFNAGVHSLPLNTSHLASGQYILVLQTPTERVHQFITVLH